jgi:hypothetical protein
VDRSVEAYQGEPVEFGRRVQAEAYRRGLGQVKAVYIVADGAVWIWNVQADRFAQALGLLDFSHASDHLWAVAQALSPDQTEHARFWVPPGLTRLLSVDLCLRNGDWDALWNQNQVAVPRCTARYRTIQNDDTESG